MSSNSYSSYRDNHTYGSSRTSSSGGQALPPLRSILGEQLDIDLRRSAHSRSASGYYDLGEMSRALPGGTSTSTMPRVPAGRRSEAVDTYVQPSHGQHSYPPVPPKYSNSNHMPYHASYTDDSRHSFNPAQSSDRIGSHGNKKYVCNWPGCEKRFERQNALETHMNIHTEERPHVCPIPNCGKAFNVRSNMRRHLNTHKDKNNAYSGPDDDMDIPEHEARHVYSSHEPVSGHKQRGHGGSSSHVATSVGASSGGHHDALPSSYYSSSRRT
ncbi:hypothetical protein K439DRAFT_918431 [Ramaria rubella]|nr:hypothetical protein K439DRAFT_918431 [Ramaria rubella]